MPDVAKQVVASGGLGVLASILAFPQLLPSLMRGGVITSPAAGGAGLRGGVQAVLSTLLGRFWPPSRIYTGSSMLVLAGVVTYFMRARETPLKDAMIAKKKADAEEKLEKLLDDAAKAKPPSPEAEAAAAQIATWAENSQWPAAYQEFLEETLKEPDGMVQIVMDLIGFHTDPANAHTGAALVGASVALVDEVTRLLNNGDLGDKLKAKFNVNDDPNESAFVDHAPDQASDGSGSGSEGDAPEDIIDDYRRDYRADRTQEAAEGVNKAADQAAGSGQPAASGGFSVEAKAGADAITAAAMTVKSWPEPIRKHFEDMLKKQDGWKQVCRDLVKHHSAPQTSPADPHVIAGASEELQNEILEVLFASDFEEKFKAKFPSFAKSVKGPTATKCMEALVDDVEESPVTALGISPTDAKYLQAVDLLEETISRELDEVVEKTVYARENDEELTEKGDKMFHVCGEDIVGEELKAFGNGEALQELLALCGKTDTYFGKERVDRVKRKTAADLLKKIGEEKKEKFRRFLRLAMPVVPVYTFALLLDGFKSALDVAVQLRMAAILDSATQPGGLAGLRSAMIRVGIIFIYRQFIEVLTSISFHRAQSGFTLVLKRSLFQHLLRQDLEYFDRNQPGTMQERLGGDTREIAQTIFSIPRTIVTNVVGVVTAFGMLWSTSRKLTLTGMIALPIVVAGNFVLISYFRKMGRRMQNYRDITADSTIEVLSNVRTVRELVMEPEEVMNYSRSMVYQNALVDRLAYSFSISGSLFMGMFVFNHLLLMYVGGEMVSTGQIGAAWLTSAAGQVNASVQRLYGLLQVRIALSSPGLAQMSKLPRHVCADDPQRDSGAGARGSHRGHHGQEVQDRAQPGAAAGADQAGAFHGADRVPRRAVQLPHPQGEPHPGRPVVHGRAGHQGCARRLRGLWQEQRDAAAPALLLQGLRHDPDRRPPD